MNLLIILAAFLCQEPPFRDADIRPAIEAAKKKAARENLRVLLLVGDNNEERSRATAVMFKKDKEVSRLILYEYEVVLRGVHNLTKSIGSPELPLLVIMESDVKELSNATAPKDPKLMIELLNKHKAPPLVAQDVLDAAKKKAAAEKKRVLLTFGAPW